MHEPPSPPLNPHDAPTFSDASGDGSASFQPAWPTREEEITLGSVARDIVKMLRQPRAILPPSSQPWKVWSRVVGLYLIGMMFAGVVASLGVKATGATNMLDEMRKNASSVEGRLLLLAMAGILAPLWEETAFRLPLAPFHAARVLPALGLIAILMLPSKSSSMQIALGVPLVLASILCIAALLSPSWNRNVAAWWKDHFGWVLAISTLAFGFAHAGNYNFATMSLQNLLLIPLLVLPQLIAGVLLAYTRLKLGFWFGVLLHSSVNTVLMLSVLAAPVEAPKTTSTPVTQPPNPAQTTRPRPTREPSISL